MSPTDGRDQVEFSRFIDCRKLPSGGKKMAIEANAKERKALEKRLSIVALDYLTAEFSVVPGKGGRVKLKGRLKAAITQTCVITLRPVAGDIDISVDRTYAVSDDACWRLQQGEPDEEGNLTGGGQVENLPEPMVDGGLDLGEAASEELALAMDSFPRLAGAEFRIDADSDGEVPVGETNNPFAVLQKLKKKLE